jgi:diacylglycerol kinase
MENITRRKSEREAFSLIKRAKSFVNAIRGLKIFIKTTHNAWIHIVCGIAVLYFGFYFNISTTKWIFIVFAIGFVLVSEAFNTAIEFDIDLTSPEYHPYAKYTKDVAAAAVLLSAITALTVGIIIFLPKFILFFCS